MHNHRFLRLVALIGTKAPLILLLDIPQAAQIHLVRLASER
jgi:hypothetical protein